MDEFTTREQPISPALRGGKEFIVIGVCTTPRHATPHQDSIPVFLVQEAAMEWKSAGRDLILRAFPEYKSCSSWRGEAVTKLRHATPRRATPRHATPRHESA